MRSFHRPGRSPVYGRNAMCATSHPAASLAAIEALRDGGNAVDAALTAAGVLAVVEPHMTGIGGDCFALIWKPGHGLVALSGAGQAPAAAEASWYSYHDITEIEQGSPHAVTVPSAIDAWTRLSRDHGRLPFERIMVPAIRYADEGFVVASRVGSDWAELVEKLSVHDAARQHLLVGGRAPEVASVMRFPAMAESLRAIARGGREAFYEGAIAEDLVGTLRALGGLHTMDDFARQKSRYVTPIVTSFAGVDVCELPPSNQGIVVLMMLKILERLDGIADCEPLSARRYHMLMEAARLAYAVRGAHVADPDKADVPIDYLLSDGVADELAGRIDPLRRKADLGPVPRPQGSDTIYLTVVDEDGMVVSFINSVYSSFGSGIVGAKSGIWLHNRGQCFALEPDHPNCIAPGKRPMHTLVPALAMKNGVPWLSFGVMGADFQPMGHVYVLTNMLWHGMDPQEALDFPRIFFEGDALGAEETVPRAIVDELTAMGHRIVPIEEPWGGGQIVEIDRARGVLIGASEPRKDGLALGY